MTREEFELLIEKYLKGEVTASEERLVNSFMDDKTALSENELIPTDEMWQSIESKVRQNIPHESVLARLRKPMLAIAASVVIFITVGFFFYQWNARKRSEWITREAPFGEKITITLIDGSKVLLNSGSSISFPREFSESIREISLHGEAFFDVIRNPKQPFEVHTGEITTKVLGTSFNINAFPNEAVSITVATGKVMVTAKVHAPTEDIEKGVILHPNEQATFKDDNWVTSSVDVVKSLAWKNNTLRFDETPLSDAASTLQRWYDVQIKFETNDILGCRINGQFKDQSLQDVLKSIQYMYNIDFKYTTQNQIILYGKGCRN